MGRKFIKEGRLCVYMCHITTVAMETQQYTPYLSYRSLMKQQFVTAHRYTVLRETQKKLDQSPVDLHVSMLRFYENVRTNNFLAGTTY